MTFVVGYRPHKDDEGPLELACQLARAYGSPVEALTVVPQGWPTAVAVACCKEPAPAHCWRAAVRCPRRCARTPTTKSPSSVPASPG